MRTPLATFAFLLALLPCGCGGAADALPGHWLQEGQQHGLEIEFAADGRFKVHGEGADHASHDHCDGTWTLTEGRLALQGRWEESGKEVRGTGALKDGVLELTIAPDAAARRFRRK